MIFSTLFKFSLIDVLESAKLPAHSGKSIL